MEGSVKPIPRGSVKTKKDFRVITVKKTYFFKINVYVGKRFLKGVDYEVNSKVLKR